MRVIFASTGAINEATYIRHEWAERTGAGHATCRRDQDVRLTLRIACITAAAQVSAPARQIEWAAPASRPISTVVASATTSQVAHFGGLVAYWGLVEGLSAAATRTASGM